MMDAVTREAVLAELMEELAQATTKKARAVVLSLKDHEPRFRPFTIEEMFVCTYKGCDAKGRDEVPTHMGLTKTGACFSGCRKHTVWIP